MHQVHIAACCLVGLGACAPAALDRDTSRPPAPDGGAADGGAVDGGDGGMIDGGADDPDDSGLPDVEEVPGAEQPVAALCHLVMDCEAVIVDEPKTDCTLVVTDEYNRVNWDGPVGAELRGRSSLDAPKHQYGVELRDAAGEEAQADLLGMGRAADWIVNGAYYDRLLVRNWLGYDLFRSMGDGRWAAESRVCDLTLDGAWLGIFHLVERPDQDGSRIDIVDDDGAGSTFILKNDESGSGPANSLGYGVWNIVYPKAPDTAQRQGINQAIAEWATAAANPSEASLGAILDLDVAVDIVLLEEFVKNNDAFFLSLRLWREDGGPMRFSPWDLDLSLGQPSYNDNENPASWLAYRPSMVATLGDIPGWDARMDSRWQELRAGSFATDAVLARIDAYQTAMGEDTIARNFEVWPIESIQFSGYLYAVGSYEEEDARVRAWVVDRLEWMDDHVGVWSAGN